jgi:two-component system OmpR family response regulator
MDTWKVLLVDDEVEFVTTLAERLELRGIDASLATDGAEALKRIEADRPQVVVLDVLMPGLGGLAVLDRIKKMDPEIKVILLTGRGSDEASDQKIPQGAFDYLIKPVNIDELIERMRQALGDPKRPGPGGKD